jgi:NADH-quinone oxidoreductase subunit L
MPLTCAAFAVGALSLCGVPGFAGFFSKDLVLEAVQDHTIPWLMLLASAFLTAFYMGRVLIKAFGGEPSEKAAHAHEPGLSMTLPLVVLMLPSLLAGLLGPWLARARGGEYEFHFIQLSPLVASTLALTGLAAAWVVYGKGREARFTRLLERLDRASAVDRGWELLYGSSMLFSWLIGWIDRYVIDGLINLVGYVTLEVGGRVRRLQTGLMRDYLTAVVVAAILLVALGAGR